MKQHLGPGLNGFVNFESYVPASTTDFPGSKSFLTRYKQRAIEAKADALGYYLPPFSYAGMQIVAAAAEAVKSLDQSAMGKFIHEQTHDTIVGKVKFGPDGEWVKGGYCRFNTGTSKAMLWINSKERVPM